MSLEVDIGGASWIGSRANQEDCYMAYNREEKLPNQGSDPRRISMGVLCDGMGGEGMGAQCACRAVRKFAEAFAETGSFNTQWVRRLEMALYAANAAIADFKRIQGTENTNSGCVLVAAVIGGERLHYISVGDAYIWWFRPHETYRGVEYHLQEQKQTNRLHLSYKKITVKNGVRQEEYITEEEAAEIYRRPTPGITVRSNPVSALIGKEINYIDDSEHHKFRERDGRNSERWLRAGDIIILASDGVEKASGPVFFESILRDFGSEEHSAAQTASEIIREVERQSTGKSDNASCIVLKIKESQQRNSSS